MSFKKMLDPRMPETVPPVCALVSSLRSHFNFRVRRTTPGPAFNRSTFHVSPPSHWLSNSHPFSARHARSTVSSPRLLHSSNVGLISAAVLWQISFPIEREIGSGWIPKRKIDLIRNVRSRIVQRGEWRRGSLVRNGDEVGDGHARQRTACDACDEERRCLDVLHETCGLVGDAGERKRRGAAVGRCGNGK